MIGRRLGRFTILAKLGEGGMGQVYLARDEELGRRVALKLLPPHLAADRSRLGRLQREARAVASLNHPNIVTLYSFEACEGLHFLSLELVEGKTLDELLPAGGFSGEDLRRIALSICEALVAAHARGITHRDLKPSNVMIGDDGRVKVLDFGLAKATLLATTVGSEAQMPTLTDTRSGFAVGTPPYMSPEQLSGGAVDHRTDLFSFGVLLYELATGRRPFPGETAGAVMASILRDEPDFDLEQLPSPLSEILDRCLRKNPAERFDNALQLLEKLRAWQPTAVSARAAPARRARWRNRAPWLVMAGLLAALSVVAALRARGGRSTPGSEAGEPLVAVPAWTSAGEAPELDRAAEGLRAGVQARLAEIPGLRVLTPAVAEGDSNGRSAGNDRLRPTVLVHGDLSTDGGELQVNVGLTDTALGVVLWSHRYASGVERASALEAEIARALGDVLSVPLSRRERARLADDPARRLRAYGYVLRGYEKLRDPAAPEAESAALELFRQATRSDPELASAQVGLSEALWRRFHRHRETADLVEAEAAAESARSLEPGLPAALLARARILRSRGDGGSAIRELGALLSELPRPDAAWRELAASYVAIGDLGEAERSLRTAVELAPNEWPNWNELGRLLQRQGDYAAAEAAYRRAAELAPGATAAPRQNLAAVAILRGEFDTAIEAYERIPGDVRDAELASNVATAYFFSNHPDKWVRAERSYRLAARLDPGNEVIQANLGDLYGALGRSAEALAQYRAALARVERKLAAGGGEDVELELRRALFAAKAGECGRAVADAVGLRARIGESADDLHLLGLTFAVCGRDDDALAALGLAVRRGVSLEMLAREPELTRLRAHPGFARLSAPR